MTEIAYRHKEKCNFLTFADGHGKALVYKEIIEKLKDNESIFVDFINKLQDMVDEEMCIAKDIHLKIDVFKGIDGVMMNAVNILHKEAFLSQFKTLVLNRKWDVRKAFIEAYATNKDEVFNESYRWTSKEEVADLIEYTKKRIFSLINKVLIKYLTQDINEDFIFVTENFQSEIFDDVSKHLKGVICTNDQKIGEPSAYSIDFGFPLVVCNQKITTDDYIIIDQENKSIILNPSNERKNKHLELVKNREDNQLKGLYFKNPNFRIFASTVDTLSIDTIAQSNYYHGLCTFKAEYYYAARGITPHLEEQTMKYVDIIRRMGKKEIFLEIPHFDHNIKLGIMGDEVTDCSGLNKFPSVFDVFLDATAAASAIMGKQLSIVIPMLITKKEISEWVIHIEAFFENRKAPRPNIGGALESEAAIMYGTDFRKLDFIIVGLDELYDEIDEDYSKLKGNAHIQMIDPVSIDDLRRIHKLLQGLKTSQRHILHGNVLTNPEILYKFLKRGFKEFAIPVNKMYLVYDVFKKHLDSVGKYIGYRAMIKAKKLVQSSEINPDEDEDEDLE